MVEALENGFKRLRLSCRYAGTSKSAGLLLEASIEKPVMVRTDVAQVDKRLHPVCEHKIRAYTKLTGDMGLKRPGKALQNARCGPERQKFLHRPDRRHYGRSVSVAIVSGAPILGIFVHLREALKRPYISARILERGRDVIGMASIARAKCFRHAVAQQEFELSDGLETRVSQPRVTFVEPDDIVISSTRNKRLAKKVRLSTT